MIRGHWSRPSYSRVVGSGVRVNDNVGGAATAATGVSSENVVNDVVNDIDDVGDRANANKDYVEMFERDDRLSAAAKKRHWLLTKLHRIRSEKKAYWQRKHIYFVVSRSTEG